MCRIICIQQDCVSFHIQVQEKEEWGCQEIEDIGLTERTKPAIQPPDSTDLNVNNLGFFNDRLLINTSQHMFKKMSQSWSPWWHKACKDFPLNKINQSLFICQAQFTSNFTHQWGQLEQTNKLPVLTLDHWAPCGMGTLLVPSTAQPRHSAGGTLLVLVRRRFFCNVLEALVVCSVPHCCTSCHSLKGYRTGTRTQIRILLSLK